MATMQISKQTTPHKHKCRRCGEEFEATCDHVYFREVVIRGRLQMETRPVPPHNFPYEVDRCAKPECAFREF